MYNLIKKEKSTQNIIGKIDNSIVSYLIKTFGDIPFVVENTNSIPINDEFFNKPIISKEHPLAQVLTWLPRVTFEENKEIQTKVKKTQKITIKTKMPEYKISYISDSNSKQFEEKEFRKLNPIKYSSNNDSYNIYFYPFSGLESKFNQYQNSNINSTYLNPFQSYSLEHKLVRNNSSPYYIPSKKSFLRY